MLANLRLLGCYSGLLLAVWCGGAPRQESATPTAVPHQARPQPFALTLLIRALLDTTAAGSTRAADGHLGLQAGAEVRAFYGTAYAAAWTGAADGDGANAAVALTLLSRAAEHGLRAADYGGARLPALRDSLTQPTSPAHRVRQQALFEVYLSDAVLRYMRDLSRGRLHPYTASVREKAAGPAGQPAVLLRAVLVSHQVATAILSGEPANREYRQLQQALARWLALPVAPDSAASHEARFEQVALNLERWRWEAVAPEAEYVWINIPGYELEVVARDSVLRRHRVVVGAPATTTPTLSSSIRSFTLSPDWHVPRSIATKELLPHLQKEASYLTRNNYALYDEGGQLLDPTRINWVAVTAQNFSYTIRQSAGCENALGNIVFRFANPYSVYLHDTPLRQFFARPDRALSHGCIRLENPLQLAAYLLRREGRPAALPSEAECARQPRPHDVRLRRPMPLYVRYATCTAENGRLRFLADIYHRDESLRRGLFSPKSQAAP